METIVLFFLLSPVFRQTSQRYLRFTISTHLFKMLKIIIRRYSFFNFCRSTNLLSRLRHDNSNLAGLVAMVMVVVVFWTATASIKWGGSDDNEMGGREQRRLWPVSD